MSYVQEKLNSLHVQIEKTETEISELKHARATSPELLYEAIDQTFAMKERELTSLREQVKQQEERLAREEQRRLEAEKQTKLNLAATTRLFNKLTGILAGEFDLTLDGQRIEIKRSFFERVFAYVVHYEGETFTLSWDYSLEENSRRIKRPETIAKRVKEMAEIQDARAKREREEKQAKRTQLETIRELFPTAKEESRWMSGDHRRGGGRSYTTIDARVTENCVVSHIHVKDDGTVSCSISGTFTVQQLKNIKAIIS